MLRLSSQTQQSRVRAQLELLLRNAEPGERLPSEPALAKRFDVSRTTIREVMSQLDTRPPCGSSDLCSSAQELSFPPVFTSVKKIGSSPGAACTRQMNIFVYWLKTVSRWPSSRKVSVYSCLGQTIPICGFSFFSQPAAPPVRTKPQSPLPNRKTTRSLNPCSRTSSIRCSF